MELEEINKKFLRAYRKLYNNQNISICLIKDENCDKISRAHTIQKEKKLRSLSENGEVLITKHGIDGLEFKLEGCKKATTFTGFCNYHDSNLFKEIEELDFNIANTKQKFLYTYRVLAHELHEKMRNVQICKKFIEALERQDEDIIEDFKFINLSSCEVSDLVKGWKMFLHAWENDVRDLNFYNEICKKALKNEKYEEVSTEGFVLEGEFGFAVAAHIYVQKDLKGKYINKVINTDDRMKPLIVNIFTENGKTYILLSCFKRDYYKYKSLIKQLNALDLKEKQIVISNLIVANVETFVYSPKKWMEIDDDKKQFIEKMFLGEYRAPKNIVNNDKFNLFE